jgi:probable 2-oxoglutarate dehydrogenase E1 component DHKTD1
MKEAATYVPLASMHLQGKWAGLIQAPPRKTVVQTGVDLELLKEIGIKSVSLPVTHEVVLHDRLARAHIEPRIQAIQNNEGLDWATAEALAFGSLLFEKFVLVSMSNFPWIQSPFRHNVRISGQDVGRGTFSQRHLMIVDQNSDVAYVPLNYLSTDQGHLEVANRFFMIFFFLVLLLLL